jgi:hypothetical protein
MARGEAGGQDVAVRKLPDDQAHGADGNDGAVRRKPEEEPLFGDKRWIEERLQALRTRARSAEPRGAA